MGNKIRFETVALPQNVKLVGEKEEKSIYISIKAYNKVHDFTKNKFDNESGGLLIGEYVEAFSAISIVIHDFIEAKYTEATKTTLTFTHKTWEYLHSEIDKNYENAKIVGWIHTHPGFGIFLSDYDKFIQNNFFNDENQVAYVVDPIQKLEGFFTIINGNLQKCKGFYIFDEVGNDIVINQNKKIVDNNKVANTKNESENIKTKSSSISQIIPYLLCVILLLVNILTFLAFSSQQKMLNAKINQLETNLRDFAQMSTNRINELGYLYQNFNNANEQEASKSQNKHNLNSDMKEVQNDKVNENSHSTEKNNKEPSANKKKSKNISTKSNID